MLDYRRLIHRLPLTWHRLPPSLVQHNHGFHFRYPLHGSAAIGETIPATWGKRSFLQPLKATVKATMRPVVASFDIKVRAITGWKSSVKFRNVLRKTREREYFVIFSQLRGKNSHLVSRCLSPFDRSRVSNIARYYY